MLPGWRQKVSHATSLERDFVFDDFPAAMGFMVRVGPVCEELQHHPNWSNVYNKVHVELHTHDAGNRVTQRDVDLAMAMNSIYDGLHAKKES